VNFIVARNPDPDSRLPYLVRLPIEGGLILKVRDTWPRTSRIFCARVDDAWPADAEILEEVAVTLCRRRVQPNSPGTCWRRLGCWVSFV
jgi:hypothetical protein